MVLWKRNFSGLEFEQKKLQISGCEDDLHYLKIEVGTYRANTLRSHDTFCKILKENNSHFEGN